jgi:hypothetical protein
MTCALHIITTIWLVATVTSFLLLSYPEYHSMISQQRWVSFAFIGLTITWVVLSRVISPLMRLLLFFMWMVSMIALVNWASTISMFGSAAAYGALTMTLIFFSLSVISSRMNFTHVFKGTFYYTTTAITIAAITLLIAPYIMDRQPEQRNVFVGMAIATVVISIFQTWNTWNYINFNPHLLEISNTCIFAVMAPWTETVDTFSSLSRFN